MHVGINITDEDIAYAEDILLKAGETFDPERRAFIKNVSTLDLQAVPGSGKTTVLLAKLLILEKFLPLKENSGILVLAHTNVAVEEIKARLVRYCPKLFSYPNYIGTIQSFVDTFLCTPSYINKYKRKIYCIDDEIYEERHYMPYKCQLFFKNRNDGEKVLLKTRIFGEDDLRLTYGEVGKMPLVDKTKDAFISLLNLKKDLRQKGILSFDDAYILSNEYLIDFPQVVKIIQNRFKFVFIDEMQDMDKKQSQILEKLFYDSSVIYQRIGDKNQSIYGGKENTEEGFWVDRDKILNLNGSHRLTKPIADLVNCFALVRNEGFQVIGLREGSIKPHLIIFDRNNFSNVIKKFSETIRSFVDKGDLKIYENSKIKAIACRRKENKKQEKISLTDYFATFSTEGSKSSMNYSSLESYLLYYEKTKRTLRAIRKNILNALIKILRIENIRESNGRYFTKAMLLTYLKKNNSDRYEELKLLLFQWSIESIRGNFDDVLNKIKAFIPILLNIFNAEVNNSSEFINSKSNFIESDKVAPIKYLSNKINYHGFDIDITTVHSVKGETHLATLYLEVDSYDAYESKRLSNQLKYTLLKGDEPVRIQEAAKLCYVGFSRPTYLLCIAIHKERFDMHLSDIDKEKWEIIELL